MSGSEVRNVYIRYFLDARRRISYYEHKKSYNAKWFIKWRDVAEKVFAICVKKRRNGIMTWSDFALAIDFYCMSVMKIYPPVYPNYSIGQERYITMFLRKKKLYPTFTSPAYVECWTDFLWSGVSVVMPHKWLIVDAAALTSNKSVLAWNNSIL